MTLRRIRLRITGRAQLADDKNEMAVIGIFHLFPPTPQRALRQVRVENTETAVVEPLDQNDSPAILGRHHGR